MERPSRKRLMLFTGSANPGLAEEVATLLDVGLGRVERSRFADGEIYIRFIDSVRGADCFVLQSHSLPINEHVMEQLIMIDALKRASAKRITAVVPFYGYARQDKKGRPREPITAKLMGDLFVAAGADRIASVDLHTGQIQGFVDTPFDSLTAIPLFEDYLSKRLEGDEDAAVERINRVLPQTQCGQCGFPGCRPYAAALLTGTAELNQCPPGGEATIQALSKLLDRPALAPDQRFGERRPGIVAIIDEEACIGCALCLQACPVDAILGAQNFMHTVIKSECTGCELCIARCPVDCIAMISSK